MAQGGRRAEVWGHPIAHSLSPALHRAAYEVLGLDGWSYGRRDVTAETLAAEFASLDASFAGLSLTMPLKTAIVPLLDSLEPVAAQLRVVNTVVFEASGTRGHNTDVYGIAEALRGIDAVRAAAPEPLAAVVLGAGATALSAIAALGELGVGELRLVTRTPLGASVPLQLARRRGMEASALGWDELAGGVACDLAVSTLPAGAAQAVVAEYRDAIPIPRLGAVDVAYPRGPLGELWNARSVSVAAGTEMLLHQAVRQVELMTGLAAPVEAMRAALTVC